MSGTPATIRRWSIAGALVLCAAMHVSGQDSSSQSSKGQSQSDVALGDVARQSRTERSSPGHTVAKHSLSEDEDGPDATGTWRVQLCPQLPCDVFSITLPKTPKWSRLADPPRPVLIPMSMQEDDPAHAIRVYAAESIERLSYLESADKTFLQGWFARPEYFGRAARLERVERLKVNNYDAKITYFSIEGVALKYRGFSIVSATGYGNFGFACVFRQEDTAAASSTCDAIIKSARFQTIWPRRLTIYPGPGEGPNDPPDDAQPD
jgi:hypothetical protein